MIIPFYFNDIFDSSTIIDWTDFDNVFFSSSYEYILLKCCDDTYIDKVKFIIKAHKCIYSDNSLSDIFCVLENNNLPIEEIGKKFGCIVRGGVVDYDKVITLIINDIKTGIIKNITFDEVSDYE